MSRIAWGQRGRWSRPRIKTRRPLLCPTACSFPPKLPTRAQRPADVSAQRLSAWTFCVCSLLSHTPLTVLSLNTSPSYTPALSPLSPAASCFSNHRPKKGSSVVQPQLLAAPLQSSAHRISFFAQGFGHTREPPVLSAGTDSSNCLLLDAPGLTAVVLPRTEIMTAYTQLELDEVQTPSRYFLLSYVTLGGPLCFLRFALLPVANRVVFSLSQKNRRPPQ